MICSQWIPVRKKNPQKTPSRRLNFRGGQQYNEYFSTPNFGTESILWRFFFSFWFLSFDFDQDNFHFDVKHFSFWLLLKSHKFIYFFSPNSAVAPSTLHAHRISIWIFSRIRMRQCTQTIWFFSTEWQQNICIQIPFLFVQREKATHKTFFRFFSFGFHSFV